MTKVLHVVPAFYPAVGFGGPIFSTLAICNEVSRKLGVDLRVLTTDAAGPNSSDKLEIRENPMKFPGGFEVHYCHRVAGASISIDLLRRLPQAIAWADVVHLTSPYNFPVIPTLLLCRSLGRPVVWSPRGGLLATAQWTQVPRRALKLIHEHVCNLVRPTNAVLHVTAQIEMDLSRTRLGDIKCVVIPNSVEVPPNLPERIWRPEGRLRLFFLSRIHPKKGLDDLISAMCRLPDYVTLDVYGTGNPDYLAALKARVISYGLSTRIFFHGHVDGEEKTRAFLSGDVLCLPTHSENFGIVVAEALAHGTPVVTTVNAPWEGLEKEGCGVQSETGPNALEEAIRSLASADLKAMGQRGRAWMARDYSLTAMANAFIQLYEELASQRERKSDFER